MSDEPERPDLPPMPPGWLPATEAQVTEMRERITRDVMARLLPSPADLERARELDDLLGRIQADPGGKLDLILGELGEIRAALDARQLGEIIGGMTAGELRDALGALTEAQRGDLRAALDAVDQAEADAWYYGQPEGN